MESLPTQHRTWKEYLQEALFPPLCFCCKKELAPFSFKVLCASCAASMSAQWHTICPVCEKPKTFSSYTRCAHISSPLSTVSYLFSYSQKPVRSLIHGLKYTFSRQALEPFTPFFEKERINFLRIPADSLIPVPLHRRKERERGFNQAKEIADRVSTCLTLPVLDKILARPRSSQPQMKTKRRRARMQNVKGLFRVDNPSDIQGQTILIVDDVMTTGATLSEAAHVLLNAGATRVHAFALAREE